MAGKPSMIALLGLLATAGYKNRDKISDMISGLNANSVNRERGQNPVTADNGVAPGDRADASQTAEQSPKQSGSLLDELSSMFGGSGAGSALSNGLSELIGHFKSSGQQEEADSWVGKGPNRELNEGSLEQSLGEDTIAELSQKTGMSRSELMSRLSKSIPDAVNDFSPEGRLPTEQEAEQYR